MKNIKAFVVLSEWDNEVIAVFSDEKKMEKFMVDYKKKIHDED